METDKRPRWYAAHIFRMPPEKREIAYERVPQEWLALIRKHVELRDEKETHKPRSADNGRA